MRTKNLGNRLSGLTKTEVIIVVATLGLLIILFLPSIATCGGGGGRSGRIHCVSNLKEIGIGFRLFANDNNGRYPGSTNDAIQAWVYFKELGKELPSPKVLICRADGDRPVNRSTIPTDFTSMENAEPASNNFSHPTHRDGSLSYFAALDADETKPAMILSGDRNLTMKPLPTGNIWNLGTNATVGWTEKIHNKAGNIGFADGSAQQMTNRKLIEQLRLTGNANNRVVLPQ